MCQIHVNLCISILDIFMPMSDVWEFLVFVLSVEILYAASSCNGFNVNVQMV